MKTTATIFYSVLFILLFAAGACTGASDNSHTADSDSDTGLPADTATDSGGPLSACGPLFGLPNEQTGLTGSQCQPTCTCNGQTFAPPQYTEAQIDALSARVLLNPPSPLAANPYDAAAPPAATAQTVCAMIPESGDPAGYRLETYASSDAASAAGATVTHTGACGLCSSLANLAVYIRHSDLTTPVRQCGIQGAIEGEEANLNCLRELGFDEPCAQIWYYNTLHTRASCFDKCQAALSAAYHLPNGQLNDCLQCDEDESGAVFKAVAGRTRRNSGLPSAICRPCETVAPILHQYP